MTGLIDWEVAARAAKRFSPSPPGVSLREAEDAVTELDSAFEFGFILAEAAHALGAPLSIG